MTVVVGIFILIVICTYLFWMKWLVKFGVDLLEKLFGH